ncbi:MAG: hypothetical protein M3367_02870 [Acidobacteriota bacterium]|nr:hypothetical protein [Acidobacteriota bacterium]
MSVKFLSPFDIVNVAALPTVGTKGRVVLLTTDNKFYGDNGTAWVDLGTTAPTGTKVSALTAASALAAADEFPINQGGNSRRATATQLKTYTSAVVGANILTDATSIAIVPVNKEPFFLSTALSRTFTIATAGVAGQTFILFIKNTSGTAVTPIFTTGATNSFRFGTDLTAASAVAAGKTNYYTFIFHQIDSRWDVVAEMKGF